MNITSTQSPAAHSGGPLAPIVIQTPCDNMNRIDQSIPSEQPTSKIPVKYIIDKDEVFELIK
jgi:hypothetical protein